MATPQRIYSTVEKRYSTQALVALGFTRDGSRMVKRGAHRTERATATSLDGTSWRVTPLDRGWRR